MSREFWRWKEYNWKSPDLDWRQAAGITAGIDVGSVSSQAVILTDGKIFAYSSQRTGSAPILANEWKQLTLVHNTSPGLAR